jgi:hypothetical protein
MKHMTHAPLALVTRALLALVLCLHLAPSLGLAGETQEEAAALRATFVAALSAYCDAPDPEVFRRAGAAALPLLSEMVEDLKLRPTQRQRALLAMQYLEAEDVSPIFRSVAVDPGRPVGLRRAAVQALVHVDGHRALDTLSRVSTDASPALREAVVRGLRRLDSPGARSLLQDVHGREEIPWLRALAVEPKPLPMAPQP